MKDGDKAAKMGGGKSMKPDPSAKKPAVPSEDAAKGGGGKK